MTVYDLVLEVNMVLAILGAALALLRGESVPGAAAPTPPWPWPAPCGAPES